MPAEEQILSSVIVITTGNLYANRIVRKVTGRRPGVDDVGSRADGIRPATNFGYGSIGGRKALSTPQLRKV
jgi:hypothetical protein